MIPSPADTLFSAVTVSSDVAAATDPGTLRVPKCSGWGITQGDFTGVEYSYDDAQYFTLFPGRPIEIVGGKPMFFRQTANGGTGTLRLDVYATDGSPEQLAFVQALAFSLSTATGGGVALADNMANPTVPQVGAHLMGYEDSVDDWSRLSIAGSWVPANFTGTNHQGIILANAALYLSNATGGQSAIQAESGASDTLAAVVLSLVPTASRTTGFNGTSWSRIRSNTAGPTTDFRLATAIGSGEMQSLTNVSANGAGTAFDLGTAHSFFSWVVIYTDGGTNPDVALEISIDGGTTWNRIDPQLTVLSNAWNSLSTLLAARVRLFVVDIAQATALDGFILAGR